MPLWMAKLRLAYGKQGLESAHAQLKSHVVGLYVPFWQTVVRNQRVELCSKLLDDEILLHEVL